MTVYEGILKQLSRGDEMSWEGTGVRTTRGLGGSFRTRQTGVDSHAGWIRRTFVDIGDRRIKTVMLQKYHDELLEDAIGQDVALSMTGPKNPLSSKRHTVIAIRTPSGVDKGVPLPRAIVGAIFTVFKYWISAVVLGVIAVFIAGAFLGAAGIVLAALFVLCWATLPFLIVARMFRARAAL